MSFKLKVKPKYVGVSKNIAPINHEEIKCVVDSDIQLIYVNEMENKKIVDLIKKVATSYLPENVSPNFVLELMNNFRGFIPKHLKIIYNTVCNIRVHGQNHEQSVNSTVYPTVKEQINSLFIKYNEVVDQYKIAIDTYNETKSPRELRSKSYTGLEYAIDAVNLAIMECHWLEKHSAVKIFEQIEKVEHFHQCSIVALEEALQTIAPSVEILKCGSEYDISMIQCCHILNLELSPILSQCLGHLKRNHCEDYLGIFRKNGRTSRVKNIIGNFKNSHFQLMDTESVYDVSSAMKKYLIRLPSKILEGTAVAKWIDITTLIKPERIPIIKKFLVQIHPTNLKALKHILDILTIVALNHTVNKMTSDNLATVFCPVLFHLGETMEDIVMVKSLKIIICDMIDDAEYLFDGINLSEHEILDDTAGASSGNTEFLLEDDVGANLNSANSFPRLQRHSGH